MRQIIMEIRNNPKKSESYVLKEEPPKDEISEEKASLLSKKSKWSKLEIFGLIIILLSIVDSLQRAAHGDLSNPISLLVNIFFNPSLGIGLIVFLYGRARRI
jgi:hypothetical protein